jgi:hypothetical protein
MTGQCRRARYTNDWCSAHERSVWVCVERMVACLADLARCADEVEAATPDGLVTKRYLVDARDVAKREFLVHPSESCNTCRSSAVDWRRAWHDAGHPVPASG